MTTLSPTTAILLNFNKNFRLLPEAFYQELKWNWLAVRVHVNIHVCSGIGHLQYEEEILLLEMIRHVET